MRYTFGGQAVDFLIEPPSVNGRVLKSLTNQTGGTAWSSQTGGSQYADLQPIGTDPAPITTDGEGRPRPFYGPDGVRDLWVGFGGARFLLRGREIGSDVDVAGLLNNPASLATQAIATTYATNTSLAAKLDTATANATFAPFSLGRPTARVGIVGDSIEIANQASVGWGNGWPILAMLKSSGRIQMVKNAAVAGTNMDHYLNTQLPTLATEDVNTIIIGGAENDIQELVAASNTVPQAMATLRARLDALVSAIHKRGAKPVLRTTAPHYYTPSHQYIVAWNHYVKTYGNNRGIPVADFYRVLVDPATGNYKSGYSQEVLTAAIHPNATSTPLIAQEFVDVVTPGIYAKVPLSETKSDPGQLSVNPAFLDLSGGAGSIPTGWSSTAVTGVTRSSVQSTGIPGNLYRLAAVGSAAISQINGAAGGATAIDNTDAVGGDVLEWSQTIISDGGVPWTSQLAIYAPGGNVYPGFSAIAGAGTFSFVRRVVVPAGMTLIQPQMFIAAGTGTVDFSHPSIRNLTREGLI